MSLPFTTPLGVNGVPRRSSSMGSGRRGSSGSSVGSDVYRPASGKGRPRSAGRPLSGNRTLSPGFTTPTKSSLHRTGALRRRPMSAGPLGPLGHRPSPGEGPRSPANEMWVGGLRSMPDRPQTAPIRRRRSASRPSSAASAASTIAAAAEAEEARNALAALQVDIDLEEAVRAAELSSDQQAYLASPSPAKVSAANRAAAVAVAAAVAAEVAAEAAELERKAQLLAEHLANESFVGAMVEELVETAVERAEEARLAEAAIDIAATMVEKAVAKLIRATAADAVAMVKEAAAAEETRLLRHTSATRIAAAYRGYAVRKRALQRGQEAQWEQREQERIGEFEQALDFLAVRTSDFVDGELVATADEGRRIRAAATTGDRSNKSGASGESRAGAVLVDAPRPRKTAAMARMTSPSAYKLRKEKEAQAAAAAAAAAKPKVRKPEYEPPVLQMLEFEAHRQAGEARWEQGDALAKGRIPPPILEQMRARAITSLSIPQSSLPPGTGNQLGVTQSLLCGDASVIAAFVERDRTALASIDLSGNFALGVAGVARLAQALPNSSVRSLNLSGCAVCGMCERDVQRQKNFHEFKIEALLELTDVLPETNLTSLNLSNCVIARPPLLGRQSDLRAVEALGAALKRDDCPLVSLNLAGNALGDQGITILAEALQEQHGHSALTELDLSSTQLLTLSADGTIVDSDGERLVVGRGLRELAVMLSLGGGNCSLSSLSLAGNELGLRMKSFADAPVVRAASVLVDALISSRLQSVDLRRTRLSLEDESTLGLALLDAISVETLRVTPSWGGRRKRRDEGMSGKRRFMAAVGVTKLGVRAIDGGTRELDEDVGDEGDDTKEDGGHHWLSFEDQAAADAAVTAGYLDSSNDRELHGGTAVTPQGATVSMIALRYVEQLASEYGARLLARARRSERPTLESESGRKVGDGAAPAGSTALHWVAARDPTAPNGVAWLRWLLARRPSSVGRRDADDRTALDHARLRNNPEYIAVLQAAVEAACTFRTRYILTARGVVDTDSGTTPRIVRYDGVDRSTGQRVTLRFYAGKTQGATAEAATLRRTATVRYTGHGGAVAVHEPKARSLALEGKTLMVQNLVTTFDAIPPPNRALDGVKSHAVSVVVVEACSRSLAQVWEERRSLAPMFLQQHPSNDEMRSDLAVTDPAIAALELDAGIAASATVVSTLAIAFMPTEEVRSLARQVLYSLVWLHEVCRTSHCDIHPGSVGQFHDGGWRLINLGHAQHFASPLPFPVRPRTCAPELARQLVADIDALLEPSRREHEDVDDVPRPPPPSAGTVTVEVVSGMALLAADRGGVSDPFVRLSLSGQREETAPQMKTSAPRFHQAFDFPVASLTGPEPLLRLEVFDKDRGSKHEFLGEACVDVAALLGAENWDDGTLVEPLPLELGDPDARLSKKCKKQAANRGPGEARCGTLTITVSFSRDHEVKDLDVQVAAEQHDEQPEEDFNTVVGSLLSVWSYDMWGLGVLLLEAATARAWDAVGADEHIAASSAASDTAPTEQQLRRLAAITPEEVEIRIKEVSDDELSDLLSMLLSLRPEDRPTAEQLLGKGGGQVRPHRFLCARGEEMHGWTDAERRRLKGVRPPPDIIRRR